MKFFQRLEVWLLLILATGVAVWVLTSSRNPQETALDVEAEAIEANAAPQPTITIHRTTLERDYGNARLDIEFRYRNAAPRTLILQPPDVRLLTADGKEVPAFILPMEKPPQIPPETAQDVRLRYWLDKPHLAGPLTLEVRGQTAEVKSAGAFDLEKLENKKPKTWAGPVR